MIIKTIKYLIGAAVLAAVFLGAFHLISFEYAIFGAIAGTVIFMILNGDLCSQSYPSEAIGKYSAFTPAQTIDNAAKLITFAKESIFAVNKDFPAQVWETEKIVEALKQAEKRGVEMKLLYESDAIDPHSKTILSMIKRGSISAKKNSKRSRRHFIDVDGKHVQLETLWRHLSEKHDITYRMSDHVFYSLIRLFSPGMRDIPQSAKEVNLTKFYTIFIGQRRKQQFNKMWAKCPNES